MLARKQWAGMVIAVVGSVSLARADSASVASIEPETIHNFEQFPASIRQLVENALSLTERDLTYMFGSAAPDNGGMDCSGTIQYTLKSVGLENLPRSSYDFYRWAEASGTLVDARGVDSVEDPVFANLRPGDLLFWQGTYSTKDRDPPISHVMIFLGWSEEDGKGIVFGSSDGRRFRGKRINGVSVFDWQVPKSGSKSKFVAYGPIPGFVTEGEPEKEAENKEREAFQRLKSGLAKFFNKSEASTR